MAGETTSTTVGDPIQVVKDQQERWELLDGLRSSDAMRNLRDRALPRYKNENTERWEHRLKRAVLLRSYWDAIEDLAARPFERVVEVEGDEDPPDWLAPVLEDPAGDGRDLTRWCQDGFQLAMHRGFVLVVVDYSAAPQVEGEDGEPRTLTAAEEQELDLRPLWTQVDPKDILGWRCGKAPNGSKRLKMLRVRETREVPDGTVGVSEEEWVRVYRFAYADEPGEQASVEFWRRRRPDESGDFAGVDGDWVMPDPPAPYAFVGDPTLPLYLNRQGYLRGDSVMPGLADENVRHYRGRADHDGKMALMRAFVVLATGFKKGEVSEQMFLSQGSLAQSTNPEADLSFPAMDSSAMTVSAEDLARSVETMNGLAQDPLQPGSTRVTATAEVRASSKDEAKIKTWVRGWEMLLALCVERTAQWLDITADRPVTFDVWDQFSLASNTPTHLVYIDKARERKDITQETYLRELLARMVLQPGVDIEAEIAATEAERQAELELVAGAMDEGEDEPPPPNEREAGGGGGEA